MYTPDISISVPATTRWKRNQMRLTDSKFSITAEKKLRNLISTRDASRFITTSFTPGFDTPKITRNEELREVSLQLVSLRKKHDLSKKINYTHQQLLDKDSKFVTKAKSIETKTISLTEKMLQQADILEKQYEEVKERQEEAIDARRVYKHILNRMKISRIKLEERSLALNHHSKFTDQILSEEIVRSRRSKETNIGTRSTLSALATYISQETKEKQERVKIAHKDATQQILNSKNREVRAKRQFEIAEAAADDERNNTAMQIREGLMVHRLLYFLLDIKHKTSQKRFAIIDEAYRKVKNKYGFIEPSEIVEKVLVKEQTYSDLLSGIAYNKQQIELQTEKNREICLKIDNINELKMQYTDPNQFWKEELAKLSKEHSVDEARYAKIQIVYEKIVLWIDRNLQKLGVEIEDKPEKLVDYFLILNQATKKNLGEKLKQSLSSSKSRVDNMKVEEVLKYYVGDEGRRRTFSSIPNFEDALELSIKDEAIP